MSEGFSQAVLVKVCADPVLRQFLLNQIVDRIRSVDGLVYSVTEQLAAILAIIGMIGGCIGLIVVEIMRLICLNDTARIFDTYAESYE